MLPTVRFVLACLLAACAHGAASAASPFLDLERYGPGSGLSQSTVTDLAEDDLGFLWVATQDGLNRFDGHRFEVLRFQPPRTDLPAATPARPLELASGSIDAMVFDREGWLWLGLNDAGLQRLNQRDGRRDWLSPEQLGAKQVGLLALHSQGGVWAGSPDGLRHVDATLKVGTPLPNTRSGVALRAQPSGAIWWLGSDCRLLEIAIDGRSRLLWQAGSDRRCSSLAQADGQTWIGSRSGWLYTLDAQGKQRQQLQLPAGADGRVAEISRVLVRANGEVLLGRSDGQLWLHQPGASPALLRLSVEPAPSSEITALFKDSTGVLWIGSYTSGLFRARSLSPLLRRELAPDPLAFGFANRSVRAVRSAGDRTLIGLDSGLLVLSADGSGRSHPGFRGQSVRALEPEPDGGWWVGTDVGLWRLQDDDSMLAIGGTELRRITALRREADRLLIATRSGLLDLRLPAAAFAPVPAALRTSFLTSLARDRNGQLWLGSNEEGVYVWDEKSEPRSLTPQDGLSHPSVWSLLAEDDSVWVGTFAGGLHRFDLQGRLQRLYAERDGLSSNVIYRIVRDSRSRLWVSTNDGLNVIDGDSGAIRVLRRQDGLRNIEFNSGASYIDARGRLWFGGPEGLDVLEPWVEEPEPALARVAISGLRLPTVVGREAQRERMGGLEVGYAQRLQLGYRDSTIGFELSALDSAAPASARLRYRLVGLESEWTALPQGRAEINYAFLPPGSYRLELQAAGRDGRFGHTRTLDVEMAPPPWASHSALFAYALLILGVVALVLLEVRRRVRQERALVDRLNREVEARTVELERANQLLTSSNLRLEEANRTDPLTQVANRRDLQHWLDELAPRVQRAVAGDPRGHHGLMLFMLDIDDFKRINDSLGHQAGDEVLVEFAQRLRAYCRGEDKLVRWGGEEFLLVVRELPREDAAALAERIRLAIAHEPLHLRSGRSLSLSCSIGFAPWPLAASWPALGEWEQSVNLADQALYEAKRRGKNGWVGLQTSSDVSRPNLLALLAASAVESWPATGLSVLRSRSTEP
ncbi:ligand-binding sensor domain-containing diguanylate cyclase [Aquimonas voraii]|uniref:diguanylate cyclase n=1 Tax=Aquimonas voraii TaxID=265719 RepID=A0A1G6V1W6_9GAMM|nr:ligand-binding sensor domain-containing diguanylate cyclase [Aquimonas voraii]SDD47474.1 diguanylate cyclase (GGDEF) domain-containing protein [Aquimonas voraii]